MPHRTTVAIGERGKTEYSMNCVICIKVIHLSGYFLRDFKGYPLNRAGLRLDYTFPDGSVKQGLLCRECNDHALSKHKLVQDATKKWIWKS